MRTCFSYMGKSGVDKERLDLARQLSKMFPEDEQVYAFFGEHLHLFSDITLNEIMGSEGYRTSSNFRERFHRNTYSLRVFRPDQKDFERWFESLFEWNHEEAA